MAEGITIRITGDDSEFLQTLASLEGEAQATLEALEASAAAAGAAFGAAAMGEGTGAAVPALFDDGEGLARQAARVAEAVARAWSGAAVLDAPSVAAPMAPARPRSAAGRDARRAAAGLRRRGGDAARGLYRGLSAPRL